MADRRRNRVFQKTAEYLDHFARFKRKENVEAVERLLSAHKELAKFERAQLGMLLLYTISFFPGYSCRNRLWEGEQHFMESWLKGSRVTMLRHRRGSKNPYSQFARQDHGR